MRRAINAFFWLVGLVVVLGVYFFVPVGRFTLFEHTLRIAATEPAQDLGEDVSSTARDLGERAVDQWDGRRAIREEAAGDTLRLRLEDDGVHLGDEVLSLQELRARIHEARQTADDLHAILEHADDVPVEDVERLTRLLRDEDVTVD